MSDTLETIMHLKSDQLTGSDKWLLCVILHCSQKNWPTSRKTLAKLASLSLSGISNSLRKLVDLGFITKQRNHDDFSGANLSSTYMLCEEALRSDGR